MFECPLWIQTDQQPIICKEKIKLLNENHQELMQTMQDYFEDAIIMGIDEHFIRNLLKQMVDQLRSPVL